ncbi:MAG: aryl-sulfate sulfotransferase [Myxococcales bacterium]|nr:aryl-sulfate sulfotransferase [Myxococcales bacterium]
MRGVWIGTLLAACEPLGNGGAEATGGCETTDHPLRFQCAVDVADDADVTWEVTEDDTLVRQLDGVGPDQLLWGLAPERTYTWTATSEGQSFTGSMTTGDLSGGLTSLQISTSGEAPDVDALLFPASCSGFSGLVMVDGAGDVVWFEDLGGDVTGFDWSDRGAVAALDKERVVEVAPDGTVLREASGFDRPLHHDVATDGDRIWLLNAEEHDGYVVDGFYVIDAGGAVEASWDLADWVTPSGGGGSDRFWASTFPGAVDWSHGNSIEVGPDGTGLLSLRWQDAVIEVVIDPDEPDFGELVWSLTGTQASSWSSDFAWTDGGGFDGQHHASWTPAGELSVFDNGASTSRAVIVALGDGTATEVAAYPMDAHCNVQGAAYVTDDATMFATCPTAGTTLAFQGNDSQASWTLSVTCPGGGGGPDSMLSRAMPIDL